MSILNDIKDRLIAAYDEATTLAPPWVFWFFLIILFPFIPIILLGLFVVLGIVSIFGFLIELFGLDF